MTSAPDPQLWRPPTSPGPWLSFVKECSNLEEMKEMAQALAHTLTPGMTLALSGTLGAGKTTLVRFIAERWQVVFLSEVTSPTYSLMHVYETRRPSRLVHLDLYRLENTQAARALGLDEELSHDDALVLVEWAERMPELLPPSAVWLHIEVLEQERRRCTLFSHSSDVHL